jgi:orotidine-5'-phosphate decarboxylase
MRHDSRLILALDETDRSKAHAVAESVADLVAAIKVNYPIILSCGLEIVEELTGLTDVICDLKVADIPNTNRLIVEQAFQRGAAGIIVHGFVGADSVKACVDAAGESGEVYVVVEMSHPGGAEYFQPVADKLALMAKEVGASGIIAPATRPERIAHFRGIVGDLRILAPGVGAQGGSLEEALSAGADYIIVGRSIYTSEDPREVAQGMVERIESFLSNVDSS